MPRRSHTTHTRDAALRDLRRINRWMIAASVVLTGILSDVAANAFPGKTVKHASASSRGKGANTKRKNSSKSTTGVLRAPQQPPAKTQSEPAQESPSEPAQESAPTSEPEATHEAAPERESPPVQEQTPPAQETAPPAQEVAPEPEAPVVSGGS